MELRKRLKKFIENMEKTLELRARLFMTANFAM